MSRRLVVLLLIGLLLAAPGTSAQDTAPTALIDAAVQDLSARVGRPLTLNDLDQWNWDQFDYPDASLGCAQPGQTYAQVVTPGYQVRLTLGGAIYDYRGTANLGIFFLCSGQAQAPAPAVGPPTATLASGDAGGAGVPGDVTETTPVVPVGAAICDGAMNSRLASGAEGSVTVARLNVRETANTAGARLGQLIAGNTFTVVGGPECGENFVWWEVTSGDLTGWVAEGGGGVYWLEPSADLTAPAATATLPPTRVPVPVPSPLPAAEVFALPEAGAALTVQNLAQLEPLIDVPVSEPLLAAAWSPDGGLLALTTAAGMRLYEMTAISLPPRAFNVPDVATESVAFNADGTLVVTGHADGALRVWDTSTGGLRAILRGHTAPVHHVAFSPTASIIASASGGPDSPADSAIRLWDVSTRSEIAALEGHTGPVSALAFSPDGALLASGGVDNTIRLWDVASASEGSVLTYHAAPVRALAFTPDGSWLISADDEGGLIMLEVEVGTQQALEGQPGPITALAVSGDGTLLAAAGGAEGERAVVIWDLATGTIAHTLPDEETAARTIVDVLFGPESVLAVGTADEASGLLRVWGIAPAA